MCSVLPRTYYHSKRYRTINLKCNINHLIKLIIRQNQLKQTNLNDIDKATDILYLSINFN